MNFNEACLNYPEAILLILPNNGEIVGANKKASAIYGYSIEQLCKMNIGDINILKPEQIKEEMNNAKNENRNFFYFPHKTSSGEIIEMEVESFPTTIDGKKVLLSIVKNYKKDCYLNNAATTYMEKSSDMVIIIDKDLKITKINEIFLKTFNFTEKEVLNKRIELIVQTKKQNIIYDFINKVKFGSIEKINTNICISEKIDSYCTLIGIPTFYRKSFFGAVITIRDKNIELKEERKRAITLQEALKKAETFRNEKDEFFARMSHDMRTPLNAVLSYSDFGIEECSTDKEKIYFKRIKSSAQYLEGLLDDILNMQKIEKNIIELNLEPTDTIEFMNGIVDIIKNKAEKKNIHFETNILSNVSRYNQFDRQRVMQIELNILNNAIKYTSNGGFVIWNKKYINNKDGYNYFYNEVIDNGIGINNKFKNVIFEPFVRVKNNTEVEEGSGLGLAITKSLVELMNGKIWFTSEIGKGSKFCFTIPVKEISKDEYNKYVLSKNINCKEYDFLGVKVLVCEDNVINYKIIKKILESKNIIVDRAENGKQCLEKLQIKNYDVIFMDIRMPVMDGLEATIEIRKFNKSIPIIALSANSYEEDKHKSFEAGMDAHLSKPIDKYELFKTLEELLKNKNI